MCQWIYFKSVDNWKSYNQEGDCLVHFVHLDTTLVKDKEFTTRLLG